MIIKALEQMFTVVADPVTVAPLINLCHHPFKGSGVYCFTHVSLTPLVLPTDITL